MYDAEWDVVDRSKRRTAAGTAGGLCPWQSVARFAKWWDDGTLEKIIHALSVDADMENLSIDSTSAKVHKSANSRENSR